MDKGVIGRLRQVCTYMNTSQVGRRVVVSESHDSFIPSPIRPYQQTRYNYGSLNNESGSLKNEMDGLSH